MILLCGIPSEGPTARLRAQLDVQGIPYALFNQRHFANMNMQYEIHGTQVTGRLRLEDRDLRLEDVCGVYTRLMDDRLLPELREEPLDSPQRSHCRALHDTLIRWCEITPARVVNRTAPMATNSSKPYQAQLIQAQGFAMPETLITNDPEQVRAFLELYGSVIYKSISGVRSIVQTLKEEDMDRLEHIRWCPTQFQAFVEGTNVRVHVVGSEVFATAIQTEAVDYRYAERQGSQADLQPTQLPDELAERCVRLAQALGLPFAGIDLKIDPNGQVSCFEVNPSPAYSYYEANTGQPIARALARYLAG